MAYYFESILLKTKLQNTNTNVLMSTDCVLSTINKWNNELSNVLMDDLCVYNVLMFPMILHLTGYK